LTSESLTMLLLDGELGKLLLHLQPESLLLHVHEVLVTIHVMRGLLSHAHVSCTLELVVRVLIVVVVIELSVERRLVVYSFLLEFNRLRRKS
jgi:hypothetical protein